MGRREVIGGPHKWIAEHATVPDLPPYGIAHGRIDAGLFAGERDEALRVSDRQGLEEQAVEDRENRGVGANTERQ